MSTQLLEIQPRELKFIFEAKKQSSCAIHLANLSDEYFAFKVKTTSPKRYCVRPNIGIVKPKSTADITVIMQAQKSTPQNMQCKDKFLIQSTVIPFGTTKEDITPSMFTKDKGIYFEECKLRVILTSPPRPPVLLPVNGMSNIDKPEVNSVVKEHLLGTENPPQPAMAGKKCEDANILLERMKFEEKDYLILGNNVVSRRVESLPENDIRDMIELDSKLRELDAKLIEAEATIGELKDDQSRMIQEKETLERELALLRQKGARRVRSGFPPLFVLAVSLISLTIGFYLHG